MLGPEPPVSLEWPSPMLVTSKVSDSLRTTRSRFSARIFMSAGRNPLHSGSSTQWPNRIVIRRGINRSTRRHRPVW